MIKLSIPREPLEFEKIMQGIEPMNLNALSKLEIFDSIDSTNTYLLRQVKLCSEPGWVCFAEEQTAGRGRRGREWVSPKGVNIYCSMMWQFPQQDVSSLSIAVAVMIAEVLNKCGIREGIQLKWPNDILFSGRKLAGILLEKVGNCVVIGIGLNIFLPRELESPLLVNSIDLYEITNEIVNRNYLAGLLVNELLVKLPLYAAQGLAAFLSDWRRYDALCGKPITVHLEEKTTAGIMQGINESGELLLLDQNNQLQYFRCGEVSVRL